MAGLLGAFAMLLIAIQVAPVGAQDDASLWIQAWHCPADTPDGGLAAACTAPLAGQPIGAPGMATADFPVTGETGGLSLSIPPGESVLLRMRILPSEYSGGGYTYAPVLYCESTSGQVTVDVPDSGYDGMIFELLDVQPGDEVSCSLYSRVVSQDVGDDSSVDESDTGANTDISVTELPATGTGSNNTGLPVEWLVLSLLLSIGAFALSGRRSLR